HWRVAVAPEPHDDDDDLQVDDGLSPHERESIVVARRLRELFDAGAHQPRDVAILVRRGKAAVPLARALGRVGVAASVVGGDGFYVRPEIADVVAALTLAVDPSDELAVLTVLRSPLVALVDDHVIALYQTLPKQRGLTWPSVLAALTDVELLHETERERVRGFDAVLRTIHARLHGSAFEGGGLARALDAIVDDAGYAASCAVEHDADLRLRNLEKLRALVASSKESALVALARLGDAIDDPPPEPLAALLSPSDDAVRIMTIHQAKGLEFPVVILADAGSGLRSESDDIGCDPLLGLAVTARGRPIAACAQRSGRSGAPTAIQRVRKKLRERNECELARVLYVALTRARDRIYVVGEPRRAGPGSLLGVLEMVRAAHSATFDALLPRVDVKARLEPEQERALPSALTAHSDGAAAMLRAPEPLPAAPRKLRAHDIGRGADAAIERLDDDEQPRLPPRTAGRLAHAIIALVAAEAPELIGDDDTLRIAVENAARACGAHDAPESILGACRATLAHPIQALLDAGASLSFNEPVSLPSGDVVVDGRADLVVRTDDGRVVVVELKLGHEPARVQASIYAAALEHSGAVDVHVALWEVGDRAPAAPAPLDHALVARALDDARAR
ncbi:MAG TPA: 3'-5' exonuclease, partial [Myxococcota bacterium]